MALTRNTLLRDATMDEVIEKSAPYLMQATGVSLDEAVSFMGALLPTLDRWKA